MSDSGPETIGQGETCSENGGEIHVLETERSSLKRKDCFSTRKLLCKNDRCGSRYGTEDVECESILLYLRMILSRLQLL